MKQLFFVASLLLSFHLYAQKQFEGSVHYTIQSFEEIKDDNENKNEPTKLIIYFMPNRMKIVADEKDEVLVFLDSAKVYTLDKNDKDYRIKKMVKRKPIDLKSKETIAGYAATPARQTGSRLGTFGSSVQLWLADELFFTIPIELADNEEMLMVQEGKIMLKAEIGMPYYEAREDDKDEESMAKVLATITATEVKPGPIDPSIFTIPADYKEENNDWAADTAVVAMDTSVWVPDTVAVKKATPKPAPVKKKPTPAPVKTKTTIKQPARKP
jgi:hypothetical protein